MREMGLVFAKGGVTHASMSVLLREACSKYLALNLREWNGDICLDISDTWASVRDRPAQAIAPRGYRTRYKVARPRATEVQRGGMERQAPPPPSRISRAAQMNVVGASRRLLYIR